ncbi:MAG: glycosyltransferase family 8 protein [Gemmatimonadaceae bacterium]
MARLEVVVACAANSSYAMPLAVMLRSALNHLDRERRLVAYVVDDSISSDDKRRVIESLTRGASVNWIEPRRENFDRLPLWGRMPITTYDKIMVADFLPPHVHRAIWLDCDMLVLADLATLWDRPFSGATTMAVQDSLVPFVSSRFGVGGYEELRMDPKTPYFNAGMMVIDVDAWRTSRISGLALEYLKKYHERVCFWDQEALNAVLAAKWNLLEAHWNWSANLDRLAGSSANHSHANSSQARLVHFSGRIKPWLINDGSSLDTAYFEMLDETAWAGWRPARTMRTRFLGWYGSSRVRRLLYPAEQWGVQLLRRFTKRNS